MAIPSEDKEPQQFPWRSQQKQERLLHCRTELPTLVTPWERAQALRWSFPC